MAIKLYSDRIEIGNFTLANDGNGINFSGVAQANAFSSSYIGGKQAAYRSGGYQDNRIYKYNFASSSSSETVGEQGPAYPLWNPGQPSTMLRWRYGGGGSASKTHGYVFGGGGPGGAPQSTSIIVKFPFAVPSVPQTAVGNLPTAGGCPEHARNGENTFTALGPPSPVAPQGYWTKFSLQSDNQSMTATSARLAANSGGVNSSSTHGYMAGQYAGSDVIAMFPFANSLPSVTSGKLNNPRYDGRAHSSKTHAYTYGGFTYSIPGGANVTSQERWPFANNGPATTTGTLAPNNGRQGSMSNEDESYGYFAGTSVGGGTFQAPYTSLTRFNFSTDNFVVDNVGTFTSDGQSANSHIQV
jgi:hypothetical protein